METRLKYTTYMTYKVYVQVYAAALYPLDLTKIEPKDVQRLYAEQLRVRSAHTVHHLHTILHGVFRDAIQVGMITRNPCEAVKPPRITEI